MTITTRFAPSPTGALHIGGVRTALFSWLYAKHHGGQLLLRIEDTDRERSTPAATQLILDSLAWLQLDYAAPPVYQSKRLARYQTIIGQLLDTGQAYRCRCSKERLQTIRERALSEGQKPRYDRACRELNITDSNSVIRFKNPVSGHVVVNDQLLGDVVFKNTELDDLIIARGDGSPTYNLTVVVDDMDMAVTDVIRGDDHLNNTPRQINILKSLNAPIPRYTHIPMLLNPEGKKLSKRDQAASVLDYRNQGYLPEALLNYLVRLGWSHGDQELFSIDEMIALFDVAAINKSNTRINPEKLLWLNQHYLNHMDGAALKAQLNTLLSQPPFLAQLDYPNNSASITDFQATINSPQLGELLEVQKKRTKTLVELVQQSLCFNQHFKIDYCQHKQYLSATQLTILENIYLALDELASEAWINDNIKTAITDTASKLDIKFGKIAQPLRIAVTGARSSPSIDDTLRLLGKALSMQRLQQAMAWIKSEMTV